MQEGYYKFSKYNFYYEKNKELYILNLLSGGFGKVKKEFHNEIINNKDQLIFEALDEQLMADLLRARIIIPANYSEINQIKALHYQQRYQNSKSQGVTIVPTLACNFSCPYCFENGNKRNLYMDDKTADVTVKYIRDLMNDKKSLSLSWFGGEPLLAFNRIIDIQKKINYLSKEKSFSVSSSIITNGYLMTKDVSAELLNIGIHSVQITIDGTRDMHNKSRVLLDGGGTYDRIKKNILEAPSDLEISIRINISRKNIGDVYEFVRNIQEEGFFRKNFHIHFSPVRDFSISKTTASDCMPIEEFAKHEVALYKELINSGLKMIEKKIQPNLSNCGAISNNSILIEPDGSLQRCWNNVGEKGKSIGSIFQKYPEKLEKNSVRSLEVEREFEMRNLEWTLWDPFEHQKCIECKLLPLCMAGCPYYSINKKESQFVYNCSALKHNINEMIELMVSKEE